MQILKNGSIHNDDWQHLADNDSVQPGRFTVSYGRWKVERDSLKKTGAEFGIRLSGDSNLAEVKDDLPGFGLIVIEFPAMADGRVFSLARLLRLRYGYTGEIRARGNYIRDQVFFLYRVGVNAFECPDGFELSELLPALSEFSFTYQAAADNPEPHYRRVSGN